MSINFVKLIIKIVALCLEKGPTIAMNLINALGKDTITCEDIEALRITKEPEEF